MAQKKVTAAKKTVVKAPVKATAKKKVARGDAYTCDICGLGVTVAQVGNVVVERDSVLLCCGKPMKKKASVKKTPKKEAAKK